VARFIRNQSPPDLDDYTKYRPFLRTDFRFVCAYCERSELFLGGQEFFEIDHFRPVHKFPERKVRYSNLYYACAKCNRHKGTTWPSLGLAERGFRFADPCEEDMYVTHLEEEPDGTLHARTRAGDYTCEHIRLNRLALRAWRQERRRIASDLEVLREIGAEMSLRLEMARDSASQPELRRQLGALQSTIALLRQRYFV
jgi:HNH endonuclease